MKHNERELLSRIKDGEREAFTIIYNYYQPLLHLEAFYKVHNHEEAEDMVQDVFTSFWKRRREIDIKLSLKSFLYKAIQNQFASKIRRKRLDEKFLRTSEFNDRDDNCYAYIEKKELGIELHKALDEVSPAACRNIMKLVYLQQKSHKEIADELHISVQVVKNQVCRAMKMLRTNFVKAT